MNTIYSKIMVGAALLALSVPAPAFAQMKDMSTKHHRPVHGQMCLEHADKLGLTDDQITKMKPAHTEMQKQQARFKADLTIAEIELAEIMDVKDFDMEKASAAVKKIEGIKTAHHLEMLKNMKEVRTNLTDEQFKNMKKIMPMKAGMKKPLKKMMKK